MNAPHPSASMERLQELISEEIRAGAGGVLGVMRACDRASERLRAEIGIPEPPKRGSEWAIADWHRSHPNPAELGAAAQASFVTAWCAQDAVLDDDDIATCYRVFYASRGTVLTNDPEFVASLRPGPDGYLTIHQGCSTSFGCDRSWTTSHAVAGEYAHRFAGPDGGMIVTRRIRRSRIVLATDARNEAEVVPADWWRWYRRAPSSRWHSEHVPADVSIGWNLRLAAKRDV